MESLREPLAVRQIAAIVVGGAGMLAAQLWLGRMPGVVGWLVLICVLQFLVQPVATLLHELGHAVAVACLGRRPALVTVGRGPWAPAKCSRITVRFSLMPSRGISLRGLCAYDPSGLPWRSIGWISLAGPIATAITFAVILAAAPTIWPAGTLARYIVVSTLVMLTESLIANLMPRQRGAHRHAATVGNRDGWAARYAFDCHKKGMAPPARRQATPPSAAANPGFISSPMPAIPAEERGALEAALMSEFESLDTYKTN
jgi:hypothetical protein